MTGPGPWVGLRPFGRDDEGRFFGRSIEIREVAELWQEHRLTLLIGDSGVGKTSLLHAGVVPFLLNSGMREVPVGDLRYQRTLPAPVMPARGRAIFTLLSSWQSPKDPARSVGLTIGEFFRRQTAAAPAGRPPLVAIDGAETAFRGVTVPAPENRRFLVELEAALRAFPGVHLLLSLRPDCVEKARDLAEALGETPARYDLGPLDRQSAIEALDRPLLGSRIQLEQGVPARLVDTLTVETDAAPGVAFVEPVLLQMLCTELWEGLRDGGGPLSVLVEKVIDDADGVLAESCTRTLFTLTTDHGLPTCEIGGWMRRTFTTSPDDASPPQARPAPQSDRPKEITETVVRAVEDRHLIKFCLLDGEDGFQLQHPRLAPALQRLGETPVVQRELAPAGLLREAEAAMSAGNLELAEKYARAVMGSTARGHVDTHTSASVILGDIAHARAEHEVAREAYDQALAIELMADAKSPAVAHLFSAIARLHLLDGDVERALGNARSGRLVTAGETIAMLEAGQAHWRARRHRAAIKELDPILDREPEHAEALRIRGEIYADWGKTAKALADLDRVTVAAPPSTLAARILAQGPEALSSLEEVERLREEGKDNGLVLIFLARAMRQRGERGLAAELADEALRTTNPRLSEHHREEAEKIAGGR